MALVLSRNIRQSIMVGDDVEITIVAVNGNQVKLAIVAPHEIPVHRREIWLRIQAEKANENGNADGNN